MRHRLLSILVLVLAATSLVMHPAHCRTASSTDQVLRVAFNELPPWKIHYPDGHWGGVDIDLLRLLAERMELRMEFYNVPFARGLLQLENGAVDMTVGVLRRPEREAYLHFIEPAYKNQTNKAFYVRRADKDKIKSYKDITGLTIGVVNAGRYFARFDEDKSLNKEITNSVRHNQNKLLRGRIDAYIGTESTDDYRLRARGLADRIVKSSYVISKRQNVYMVLSKKSPLAGRLEEFSSRLRELVENGTMERLKQKYLRPAP